MSDEHARARELIANPAIRLALTVDVSHYEAVRDFAVWQQAEIERLQSKAALLEHEADCYWCAICSPGKWTRDHCPECRQLQEALEAAEAKADKRA